MDAFEMGEKAVSGKIVAGRGMAQLKIKRSREMGTLLKEKGRRTQGGLVPKRGVKAVGQG